MAYQLVVNRQWHNDVMTLVCELKQSPTDMNQLKAKMEMAIKEDLRISGEVQFQEPAPCLKAARLSRQ